MEHFASFDGTPIAYLDEGSGPPVLLLHGFAADHQANWVTPHVVEALVGAGHRVIAGDARGHGQSGKPHDPAAYAGDAMVRDAKALLDHLAIGPVDVVGYSMGAMVAARLTPVEPRVRALVLGGIGSGLLHGSRPRGLGPAMADALEAEDPATITDPVAKAFRAFADSTGADRLALAAIQRAPAAPAVDVPGIGVPTLVISGDRDTLVGPPHELAAAIPGGRAVVVSGDHLTAVGDPAFRAAIVDFLATSPGRC